MPRRPLLAAAFLASLAVAPAALGQGGDAGAGAILFREGRALLERGQYAEACAKFDAAEKLVPSPGILLNLAECQDKLGRTGTAYAFLQEAAILAGRLHDERETEARRRAALLEPRLARIQLDMSPDNRGAGLIVKRDGVEMPEAGWDTAFPVDPGAHTLEAWSGGQLVWSTRVTIAATPGVSKVQVPSLRSAAASAFWSTQRIAGASVAGAGVVGLAVGAAFGGIAMSKKSQSNANGCNASTDVCNSNGLGLRADGLRAGNIATGLFAAGGAAIVAGVAVFFTAPSGPRPTVGLSVGPGSVQLTGRW